MKRVCQIPLLAVLGYLAASVSFGLDGSGPGARGSRANSLSNVFLITIDTLRADHVGCYGARSIHTPVLDRLAADGIRFDNAFSPSPITNAAHASILTGLIPIRHGVRNFGMALPPGVTTLAEML